PPGPRSGRALRRGRAHPRARRDAGLWADRHEPGLSRTMTYSPTRCCCSSAAFTTVSPSRSRCNGVDGSKLLRLLPKGAVAKLREEVKTAPAAPTVGAAQPVK